MSGTSVAFRSIDDWEQRPAGQVHADVADVAVDAQDRVYLFTRRDPRVFVYEADGGHVATWGEGVFTARPHGIHVSADGLVYCVDEFDQTVLKFTPDGEAVGVIGESGVASDTGIDWEAGYSSFREQLAAITHGGAPFNHPTKAVVAPSGDVYVSDGYGNARVHRFSADGELIRSWGEPGSGLGEFRAPHCVAVHDDRVWVCDRDNERLQIFELDGTFIEEWTQLQRPSSIAFDSGGRIYISEQGWKAGDHSWRNGPIEQPLPASVVILEPDGTIVDRFGSDRFFAPHGIAVDSAGSIYVAEVVGAWFGYDSVPPEACTFHKFVLA